MTQSNNHLYTSHGVGDSLYTHQRFSSSWKLLALATGLTISFALVEVIGGVLANSLALISDAGHMVTDSFSLFFALIANWFSRSPASNRFSFGLAKTEVIVSFINGLLMIGVVFWIVFEAVERFNQPLPVNGGNVFIVASIGLVINITVAYILSRDKKNLNIRAALVHVMGDLLGSLAALVAGGLIYLGGPEVLDPALSLFVACLILKSTYSIIKTSVSQLMDAVPDEIAYQRVGKEINDIEGVVEVHDLHIWYMSPEEIALQAHLEISNLQLWPNILQEARSRLNSHYGITHITLQPELAQSEK